MKDLFSSSSDVHIVESAAQAKLLSDPTTVYYFKPFVGQSKALSVAATELNCHLNTLYYRVQQFLAAGLLIVSHEEKRKGRAIKHYRSVKDVLFIPYTATPYADLKEGLEEQLKPLWCSLMEGLAQTYRQHGIYGKKIFRDEHNIVMTMQSSSPDAPSDLNQGLELGAFLSDFVIFLSDQEVQELHSKLADLMESMLSHGSATAEASANKKPYILEAALVPYWGV